MKRLLAIAAVSAGLGLAACSDLGGGEFGYSDYTAVSVKRVNVADGTMTVVPPRPWNRRRGNFFDDIRETEDWTLNGPYLDGISFVGGLKDNKNIIRQWRTDSQQVPRFHSNMTPPEIAALLESLFRVKGGAVDFKTLSIAPRPFLGASGFQFDYEHLDQDELWRKGRAVGAVINGRLYLILLDAARMHYFSATLPDFEAVVASAQLRR